MGGITASADFPVTPGAYQTTFKRGNGEFGCFCDGYVAKIALGGSSLSYSTFPGGAAMTT